MRSSLGSLIVLVLCDIVQCEPKPPSIFISVLIRNKAHTLPYFLTTLYRQDYQKSRIVLYFKVDNSQDESIEVLEKWLDEMLPKKEYHDIIKDVERCTAGTCEGDTGWSESRFSHIMQLRQNSLDLARFSLADFYFSLDADVFLTDPECLSSLVNKNLMIVSPMLSSIGLYSNFWAGMSETFYYQRTDEYKKILNRKKVGCYQVPMVHTAVLIDLREEESDLLTFLPENIPDYPGPRDDIIVLALSASLRSVALHVCNDRYYGTLTIPLEEGQTLQDDKEILRYSLMEVTTRSPPLVPDAVFSTNLVSIPEKTKLGFDEIYLINLDRRKDRLERMKYNFDLLGMDYLHFPAVDGKSMDREYVLENNIKMLPEFEEPYHGRPLTYGEIGCFMSHYNIWQDMVTRNLDTVLILEDDIRFEAFFIPKLAMLMEELRTRREDWELVYIGRKILHNSEENWVEESNQLVYVDYTYWTLGYIIRRAGVEKLLSADPLGKMVPVDEFLPIMYDRHPNKTWAHHFHTRDLKALSVHPLLVNPTHYTGEEGYISDTEDTSVIEDANVLEGDQDDGELSEKPAEREEL